ncbi:MAG: hypothetical protein EOP10_05205 [Proteobacteria bacterium]|nr:MAG: hypothetical protein EOP10_05205 [Pseudomonadota bacterium]
MKFLYTALIALSLSHLGAAQTNPTPEVAAPNQTGTRANPTPTPTPNTNPNANSTPNDPVKTDSQVTPQAVTTPIIRPEPTPIPVPATAKTGDQIGYEDQMQIRFDEAAKTLKDLQTRLETYEKSGHDISLNQLQTAQGNRSVTRTKLKQLKFITPSQWSSLQSGIDKAFSNLDSSIVTLKSYVESLEKPRTAP